MIADWVLIVLLTTGPLVLERGLTREACARTAARIEQRHDDEAKSSPLNRTYPGLRHVHCERIDR
jgi:hypothetical protein